MKHIYKTLLLSAALGTSLMTTSTNSYACGGDGADLIGSICAFGGNFAPRGYALADGRLLPISQNSALFSIFGTMYGGDGRTTFALPDLRGRSMVGSGNGPGLTSMIVGQRGGVERVTLSTAQMPSHNHTINATITNNLDFSASTATLKAFAGNADTNSPTGNVLANSPRRENIYLSGVPNVDMGEESILLDIQSTGELTVSGDANATGGGQAIATRSPYLAVTYLVTLTGIFPSRS